jgi:hypothetical protein
MAGAGHNLISLPSQITDSPTNDSHQEPNPHPKEPARHEHR